MSSASASIAAWQRHAVVHPGSSGANAWRRNLSLRHVPIGTGKIALCFACARACSPCINNCPLIRI